MNFPGGERGVANWDNCHVGDHRNRGPEPEIHLLKGEYNLLCAEVDLGMKELGFKGENNRGVGNRDRIGERSKEKGDKLAR